MTTSMVAPATEPVGRVWRPILRLDLRLVRRGAVILTALVAGLTAVVMLQYPTLFSSPADVAGLRLLAENPAIRLLFGVPRALDSAGGFTVWRTGTIAAVAVAAWAMTAATRLTRGEEDTGRSWLLLAAPVRLPATVVVHLGAVGALVCLVALATMVAMVATGSGVRGAVVYAAGLAGVGLLFAAVGGLFGQLLGERSLAAGASSGVLVVGLLAKMVGDGVDELGWIRWGTPFGLVSLSEPFAADRALPLLALALAAGATGLAAWWVAGRRDLGAGVLPQRGERAARTRLLTSRTALAVRHALGPTLGWGAALAVYFLLIGLLAVSLTEFLLANPRFAELAAAAGFGDLVSVQGYVASIFRLLPIPIGVFAAVRFARVAADESRGRLTLLFATPARRVSWPLSEAVAVTAACLVLTLAAGAATWLGTTVVDAGLGLGESLVGAVNGLPVALLSVGAAGLAWGWLPRAVLPVGALPTVGGFVWWVLAETLGWSDRVSGLSPFAHLASAPAVPPDRGATAALLMIGVVLMTGGLIGFARRDLRS
ncbi:MAG TPA: hypothetical protein VIT41_11185 [Microlunatus sp.]